VVPALLDQMGIARSSLESECCRSSSDMRALRRGRPRFGPHGAFRRLWRRRQALPDVFQDEYVSAEHLFVAIAESPGDLAPLFRTIGIDSSRISQSAQNGPWLAASFRSDPETKIPGPRPLWKGLDASRASGKARPGDRER